MENIISYIFSNLAWIMSGIGVSVISILANIITSWLMMKKEKDITISIKTKDGLQESISLKGLSEKEILEILDKINGSASNK